jgi:methyl-accepting chemotaxis protein
MLSIFRPADWPIATKLVIAFLIIALVPIGVITLIGQGQARDGLLAAAKLNLQNTVQRSSLALNRALTDRLNDVEQTASSAPIVQLMNLINTDRSQLDPRKNNILVDALSQLQVRSRANGDAYFFVVGLTGRVEITSTGDGSIPAGELRDVSDQIYYTTAMKELRYISDPVLVSSDKGQLKIDIFYSGVVRDPTNGAVLGVLVERTDISNLWSLVESDKEAAGPGSFSMLVDQAGISLADSRTAGNRDTGLAQYIFKIIRNVPSNGGRSTYADRYPANNFDLPSYQAPIDNIYDHAQDLRSPTGEEQFFATTLNGKPAEAGFNKLNEKNWSYFVIVPASTYAAAADNITTTAGFTALIVAILVILIALAIARLLTTPVRSITRVLGRIGIGDFEARVSIRGHDELGHLGDALNAMFDNTLALIQTREERDSMADQITRLLDEISTVAEGDLTVQAEVTADITGAIADSFNLMIEELRKIILNIQSATGQTTQVLDQLLYNSQRTDQAGELQASRIIGINSAIGNLNQAIQQVSEGANVSAQVAQEARINANNGGMAVTRTINSMNRIRSNVQETSKKIKRLGESSQQIGDIVRLIDDIADQTNMLALNAAIQATAAGEQGKGFSVVAEEVRRLAERSAKATREIASLVKSIQDDTNEAVVSMEESTREVVDGSKLADEAGQALGAIERVVERLATLILNISQLSQDQTTTSGAIAGSMDEIAQLTQEATQLRRESSEAVGLVAMTAAQLNNSVSAFRLPMSDEMPTTNIPAQVYAPTPPPSPSIYAPPVPSVPTSTSGTLASSANVEAQVEPSPTQFTPVASASNESAADGGSSQVPEFKLEGSTVPIEPGWDFDLDNLLKEDTSFYDSLMQDNIATIDNTSPTAYADDDKAEVMHEIKDTPTTPGPKKGQAVG